MQLAITTDLFRLLILLTPRSACSLLTLEMGGPNCNSKMELKKGPWTREEDQKLLAYIEQHGHGSWRTLPTKAGIHSHIYILLVPKFNSQA